MDEKQYCVYIMTNQRNTVFYIGVTSNLPGRVWQHKEKLVPGFTERYNVDKLIYYEVCHDPYAAITREKEIKKWRREKKLWLVKKMNPGLDDLSRTL